MINDKEYCELFLKAKRSKEEDKKIQDYNKKLIKDFPFLMPCEILDKEEMQTYDYQVTWLDNMPIGWRIAFGIKMCEEIKNQLLRIPFGDSGTLLDNYKITDIKEKYGSLCWYDSCGNEEIKKIIDKYEKISWDTCIVCGSTATLESAGWISPYCEECAKKEYKRVNFKTPFEKVFFPKKENN